MKVLLRNLTTAPLPLDFTGYDVVPLATSVLPGKSQMVETSLPLLEFRKIPDVATALGAGNLTVSMRGGSKVLN